MSHVPSLGRDTKGTWRFQKEDEKSALFTNSIARSLFLVAALGLLKLFPICLFSIMSVLVQFSPIGNDSRVLSPHYIPIVSTSSTFTSLLRLSSSPDGDGDLR